MSKALNPYGLALINEATGSSAFPYDYKPIVSGYGAAQVVGNIAIAKTSLANGDPVSIAPFMGSTTNPWTSALLNGGVTGSIVKTPLQYVGSNGTSVVSVSADTTIHSLPIYGVFANVSYINQKNKSIEEEYFDGGTTFASTGDGTTPYGRVAVLVGLENRYRIQANGPVYKNMIGLNFNMAYSGSGSNSLVRAVGNPNAATKTSTACLDVKAVNSDVAALASAVNNLATLQLTIEDLAPGRENNWGDAFTNVVVRINTHRFKPGTAASA